MNKNPSHSNITPFVKNESNTTPILYQHPKPSEIGKKRFSQLIADLRDLGIFLIFALVSWLVISALVYSLGA